MNQKKALVLLVLIILVVLSTIFYLVLNNSQNKSSIQKIDSVTPEKKEQVKNIRSKKGTLESVDLGAVVFLPNNQEQRIALKVPSQGISFINQTQKEDGVFLNEKIGLLDLPLNEEVEVQYDSAKNEAMMITVYK